MGQTNPEDFGNGGTIDGDLTVSGDLQVSGGGSLSFDEIVQGTQVIDVDNTEALLVRKDGDGGDVFVVDTTNSRVGIGTTNPASLLSIKGQDPTFTIESNRDTVSSSEILGQIDFRTNEDSFSGEPATSARIKVVEDQYSATTMSFHTSTNPDDSLNTAMTINKDGVGIGTASPDQLLHINAGSSDNAFVKLSTTGSGEAGFYIDGDDGDFSGHWTFIGVDNTNNNLTFNNVGADDIIFKTTNTERMRIDSSGRLGLGTTPEAFTLFTPLQISTSAVLTGRSGHNQVDLANNWYYDGTSKRINTGYVTRYTQSSDGEHQFYTAGTSTADSAIGFGSAKLTISNSGNVSIGTTATYGNLTVGGTGEIIAGRASSGAGSFSMYEAGTTRFVIESLNGSNGMAFKIPSTEAMRIDSSGNLGIGISPVASQKLHVKASSDINFTVSAVGSALRLNAVNDAVSAMYL